MVGAAGSGVRLSRPSPQVVLTLAVVLLLVGTWQLRLSPADAAVAVAPALEVAADHAADTGVPATVWAFGSDLPDPQAPLAAGLDALPEDVEVRVWPPAEPRHHAAGWRHGGLLEVQVAGRPGRACLRLRPANPGSVVRVGVSAVPRPAPRAPGLQACATARSDGPPALVRRAGTLRAEGA